MKLAFIGGGTMAEAILKGVLDAGLVGPGEISVGEPVPSRREFLAKTYGVNLHQDNPPAAAGADLVILAVKPQDLGRVFGQLGPGMALGQAALSIVAGAKMSTLSKGLDHEAVIRVMPNTPAQIGCGMSLWTCSEEVDESLRDLTKSILATIGIELFVDDEKYLDMATALSASGPAYVFLFIEALIDAGVYVGLPRDMARTLALQTVYGSVRLVSETGRHPAELKDMVVSPGGTTAEGLRALEKGGLSGLMVEAVDAAYQKSIKLGQG